MSTSIPERKSKSVSVCETLPKSRPNNDNSVESLPSQAEGAEPRRKTSLGGAASLPLPQRSLSTGRYHHHHHHHHHHQALILKDEKVEIPEMNFFVKL